MKGFIEITVSGGNTILVNCTEISTAYRDKDTNSLKLVLRRNKKDGTPTVLHPEGSYEDLKSKIANAMSD